MSIQPQTSQRTAWNASRGDGFGYSGQRMAIGFSVGRERQRCDRMHDLCGITMQVPGHFPPYTVFLACKLLVVNILARMRLPHFAISLCLAVLTIFAPVLQGELAAGSLPFTVTAISRNGSTLFVCGADLGIASSSDGGVHWDVRNRRADAGTLLTIGWANNDLGFAGGTGGFILLTADGGTTWKQVPGSFSEPVLQLSFADEQHGIVVTTAAVLYTKDAGRNWQSVLPSESAELSRFRFVLEVATLDSKSAVALMKLGPVQYYDGRLVTTTDAGATWKITEIENTTLNNLLIVRGEYWLVGTEVIDKQNHGGHAVAVTFHSHDGAAWERGPRPPVDTNYACRPEGCLMWNGAWFDPFAANGKIHIFPKIENLSTQWSATDARICTLAPELQCADATSSAALPEYGPGAPQLAALGLRPTTEDMAGKCIRCDFPHILLSDKFSGPATVDLTIHARPDGTVSSVEVGNTADAEIGSELARAARAWIFYPVLRDRTAVPTKRTVKLVVNVIKRS